MVHHTRNHNQEPHHTNQPPTFATWGEKSLSQENLGKSPTAPPPFLECLPIVSSLLLSLPGDPSNSQSPLPS